MKPHKENEPLNFGCTMQIEVLVETSHTYLQKYYNLKMGFLGLGHINVLLGTASNVYMLPNQAGTIVAS